MLGGERNVDVAVGVVGEKVFMGDKGVGGKFGRIKNDGWHKGYGKFENCGVCVNNRYGPYGDISSGISSFVCAMLTGFGTDGGDGYLPIGRAGGAILVPFG